MASLPLLGGGVFLHLLNSPFYIGFRGSLRSIAGVVSGRARIGRGGRGWPLRQIHVRSSILMGQNNRHELRPQTSLAAWRLRHTILQASGPCVQGSSHPAQVAIWCSVKACRPAEQAHGSPTPRNANLVLLTRPCQALSKDGKPHLLLHLVGSPPRSCLGCRYF